jgi:uncharacterized membrane protein YfbV (UPF0208 family)
MAIHPDQLVYRSQDQLDTLAVAVDAVATLQVAMAIHCQSLVAVGYHTTDQLVDHVLAMHVPVVHHPVQSGAMDVPLQSHSQDQRDHLVAGLQYMQCRV